jgi:hypothetical protein
VETVAYFLERFARRQPEFIVGYEATENQRKVAEANAHAYTAAQRKASPRKLPRYVAVDTAQDKRAAPTTKRVVMIWDTQSETLVGNVIYDVENVPRVGSTAIFQGNSAEYVDRGGQPLHHANPQ